jgi:hypothetical protein
MLESRLAGRPVSLHKRSTTMGIVNNERAPRTQRVSFRRTAGPCLRAGWLAGKCLVRVPPSLSLLLHTRVQHTRGCLPRASEVAHWAHALPPGSHHTMSTNCTSPAQQLSQLSLSQVKRHTRSAV